MALFSVLNYYHTLAHYAKIWSWSMYASRENLSTCSVALVTGEIGMSALVERPWCGLEK